MSDTLDIIKDGSDQSFMADVITASQDTPVVVDFWAPWCGPCKQLMPVLERVVKDAKGGVKMVKINIDENPGIAGQLGVRSIPAVYAFKDGKPVDFFGGAQPESELKKFVARLTGEADVEAEAAQLVARAKDSLAAGDPGGAAQDFAQALQLNPESAEALAGLARVYIASGNMDGAAEIINSAPESMHEHAEIKAVKASKSGGAWRFDVTLSHGDTGWDHYADAWRVVDGEGNVLGNRELLHPHVDEQPFTRSLSGITVPEHVRKVFIEAHDKVHGWTKRRLLVDLAKVKEGYLKVLSDY